MSTIPYYSISSPTEIIEGKDLVLTIKTKNLTGSLNPHKSGDSQYLAWKISGEGYNSDDLDGSYPLDGGGVSVNRSGDDEVSLTIKVKADNNIEGNEKWKITLYSRMEASPAYEVASTTVKVKDSEVISIKNETASQNLGYYAVSSGTESRDVKTGLTSGDAYFAQGGDDYISINGKTYLPFQGQTWWIPALVNGGPGNDEYSVGPGSAAIIADASSSTGDSLKIYDYMTNIIDFFSIENRHVFIGTSWGTFIVIVDGLNNEGLIETISFSDITLSISASTTKSLLNQYQTRPDQTLDGLKDQGLFNPNAMGIRDEQVRSIINSLSKPSLNSSLTLDKNYSSDSIIQSILGSIGTPSSALSQDVSDKPLTINASTWSGSIKINLAAKASDKGETLTAKQIDFSNPDVYGSVIQGGSGNDVLMGKAGWDILDGGAGNDLIHGGNGRDIITGGTGSDELWGDFGWNTYKSEKDGSSDLIAVKSDQWLENWMYAKAGNNPNGEKADILEGLDSTDKIRIVGVYTSDLTVSANATAHGVSGIGIYAKGSLEALYTGGDLSVAQITAMTTGDASAAAMNNNINSYGWTSHPGTFVAS